jgi:dihydroflavonol-4-reductase
MKIGITGAYGFLGASIVAEALRQGHEPRVFYSRRREHPLFDNKDVDMSPLTLGPGCRPDLGGLDALIHAAGAVSFSAADKRSSWDINVLGSRALYEAALRDGLSRFVDLSSVNALGSLDGKASDESRFAAYDPAYPSQFSSPEEALAAADASIAGDYRVLRRSRVMYFDSKLAAYELSRRYHRERGLPVVTVFPGTAVGPGELNGGIGSLVDMVWRGELGIAPAGSTSYMDSGDFARGCLAALDRGVAGEGYILAGRDEDTMSYRDFLLRVAAVARRDDPASKARLRIRVVAPRLAIMLAPLAERFLPSLKLTSALVLSGCLKQRYSSAKAIRELGYAPTSDLDDSIRACRRFNLAYAASKKKER